MRLRCPERLQSFGCGAMAMRSWPGQGRQLAEVAQPASVLALQGGGTLWAPGSADSCLVARGAGRAGGVWETPSHPVPPLKTE